MAFNWKAFCKREILFGSVTNFVETCSVGVVSVNKIIFNIVKTVLASVRILKG